VLGAEAAGLTHARTEPLRTHTQNGAADITRTFFQACLRVSQQQVSSADFDSSTSIFATATKCNSKSMVGGNGKGCMLVALNMFQQSKNICRNRGGRNKFLDDGALVTPERPPFCECAANVVRNRLSKRTFLCRRCTAIVCVAWWLVGWDGVAWHQHAGVMLT
jgi:hypothetical protein